jgi:hypothetical protein
MNKQTIADKEIAGKCMLIRGVEKTSEQMTAL